MKVFLVGGAVRDKVLGKEPVDQDFVVVGSTTEEMLSLGFQKVGAAFPVFLHPETKFEHALARREKKVAPGYRGFEVEFGPDVTLFEDLARRDFTMNSMAMDLDTGEVFDPFGGADDLQKGVLRATDLKAFSEDPLRVLRMVRFACRFFLQPTPETLDAARLAVGELTTLSQERVTDELSRAMVQAQAPSWVLRLLSSVGALRVLLPEIEALRGVPQPSKHHPEGPVFEHVLQAMDNLKRPTATKLWAVMLHDSGKAKTPQQDWPAHHDHENLGVPVAQGVVDRFKLPTKTKQFVLKVVRHHMQAHRWDVMRPGSLFDFLTDLGVLRDEALLQDFLDVFDADWGARVGDDVKAKRREFLTQAVRLCKSQDMAKFLPKAELAKDKAKFWAEATRGEGARVLAAWKKEFLVS